MKSKRLVSICLVTAFLTILFSLIQFSDESYAATKGILINGTNKYFYNQLTEDAKVFYYAMEKMLADGSLKTGTASYDFITDGKYAEISQEKIEDCAMGNKQLLKSFSSARDAFSAEHPEVFYVDYDCISFRISKSNGVFNASIGTGKKGSYLNKQFANEKEVDIAINTINNKIDKIVDYVTSKEFENGMKKGQNKQEQQIKYVHDEIIKSAIYNLEENVSKPEYAYSIRTAYGVLENGEAVCEGFSRAFKMILDKLDIPCVLVIGEYMHTANQTENHMWTYVRLEDEKWYGIDPTFDNTDDEGGEISTKYFLAGNEKMSTEHIPTGIISSSNYKFSYPTLN